MTWRTQPPDEGQCRVLLEAGITPPATKAEASKMIKALPKYQSRKHRDIVISGDPSRKFPTPRTFNEINHDH